MSRIALVALVFVVAHLWTLRLPPLGHDSWRQCDVLGVGRNYCEEHASFWSPLVDSRGDTSGVTGMEFPILNWIEGQFACAGLDQVFVGRSLTLLFSVLAILCIGLLEGGWLTATVFATSPLVWYFGVSVQPDMPAVALMLASLVLLQRSLRSQISTGLFLLSAALAALGILIKLPVIVFGLPAAAMVITRLRWRGAVRDLRCWAYLAVAIAPSVGWYRHARALQDQSGLHTFFLGKSAALVVADLLRPSLYTSVFVQKLFDAYAFPVFSALAIAAFVLWWRRFPVWTRTLAVATLLYVLLTGQQVEHHFYYGLPIVPAIAFGAAAAMSWARDLFTARVRFPVLVLLLAGSCVYAWTRVEHWWPRPHEAEAYDRARNEIDKRLPADARIVVFAGENPTLLWMLHRKGWLAPFDATEWFARAAPPSRLFALDRRMGSVEQNRDALLAQFRAAGAEPLVTDAALDVWIKPR